jgi:hypothetical protein
VSFYKIRVKGHLDGRWSEWFDGLEITNLQNAETMLSGDIVDQAALHGVLAKVGDLNLALVAVSSEGPQHQDPDIRPAWHYTDQARSGRTSRKGEGSRTLGPGLFTKVQPS